MAERALLAVFAHPDDESFRPDSAFHARRVAADFLLGALGWCLRPVPVCWAVSLQTGLAGGRGTVIVTFVPRRGWVWMCRLPPSSRARSRMPISPK